MIRKPILSDIACHIGVFIGVLVCGGGFATLIFLGLSN